MTPKITQKMALKQQLSPKQVLEASLLQLNLPLLEQRILHELEINPALELSDMSTDLELEEISEVDSEVEEDIEFEWEELLGVNDDYEYPKSKGNKDKDVDIPLIANESFSEQILKQLQDSNVSEEELVISEHIIGNLDEQGYLNIDPSLISDRLNIDEKDVINVMYKIQHLDPPGLAARNIQECLLVQAEICNENTEAIILLRDYFDDFVNHRYEKIIESLGCTKDALNEAMEFISRLNPSPRDDQVPGNLDTIIPDVAVEDRNGQLVVVIQDSLLPEIRVSKTYVDMLKAHKNEKEVKNFINKKLESANWFVEAVQNRKQTIQLVMESILKHQKDYFDSEKRILKPMVLKDIADDIGIDISTVSRVTSGKYVQLPWEVKEIKTFFSEGIVTKSGKSVSNIQVKDYLKNIIDSEDKNKPISDENLMEILNKQGYKIARRTVAKYREQLKIPTARLRRGLK